jgi:DNA-binding SARP family transcriptional activator/Flp pilus assembly protein TadD
MLQLKLLGSLSLQSDTDPVPAAAMQKRRLGLLALLGIAGERGISRDRLQTYLWPESSSDRSRHALDQLVYAVRRSLPANPISSEGRDLRLDPQVIGTDLAKFTAAIESGELEKAVAAYGGSLLDGFYLSDSRELESGIDAERLRLEEEYQSVLEKLAKDAASRNDKVAAIAWWKKLAASDPLSSRFAIELIRALAESGEIPAAIQHARAYQQLVREELEVEPDPRIEKLAGMISRSPDADPDVPHVRRGNGTIPVAVPSRDNGSSRRIRMAAIAAMVIVMLASLAFFQRVRARTVRAAPAARTLYLRGLNSWNARSKDGLDTAVVYFRRAVELDPEYGEAYGGLANAYVLLGYSGYRPADAMFPKARATALRAISIDSTLAPPYAALGLELTWERRFDDAERAFTKAIALDPGYPTAHQWYGMLLKILGRMDDAVRETGIAAELDPLSLQIQNTYATFLRASGNAKASLAHYQKIAGEEPDSAWVRRNPWLLTNMSATYASNGMFDKALDAARRSIQITSRHPRSIAALASVYAEMGRPDLARKIFAQVDTANEHYTAQRAFFYVDIGELDSAFLYFDQVKQWPIPILISLGGARGPLHDDPRYARLLKRLGMPVPR